MDRINGGNGVVDGVTNDLFNNDMVDGFIDGYRISRTSVGVCETVGEESINGWNRCVAP